MTEASHDGAGRSLHRGVSRLPGRLAGRAAHADQVRLTVLGGSAPATVQLVEALAGDGAELPHGLLGPVELVLHGRSQTRLAAVARAARMRVTELGMRMPVRAQVSRTAALDGASIVLNQIRPGRLACGLSTNRSRKPSAFPARKRSALAASPARSGPFLPCGRSGPTSPATARTRC